MFDIYGILATESVDRTGEQMSIEGADIDDLKYINDDHKSSLLLEILGSVKQAKKIWKESDCEDQLMYNCWNRVKKPFIYVRGSLASPEHPNAAAAEGLIRYSFQNPDFPVGWSVEGATMLRQGRKLMKTKIIAASLTVKPCNTECLVFPVMDLRKSLREEILPEKYAHLAPARKYFRNIPTVEDRLLCKSQLIGDVKNLMKSDAALNDATLIKCWNCGEGKIFMKNRPPNRCVACGESFHLSDIYNARKNPSPIF